MWKLSVVLGALVACGDDGATVTAGSFGAMCTAVTDMGSTECDTGVCTDVFEMIGYPVCSQKCTPGDGSTCPEGSEGKKCNMRGYCRP